MKIFVTAKPRARQETIEQIDETHFIVSVTEPPIEGKANAAIARVLAKQFNVARSSIELISGHTSIFKIFEIHTV